MLDTINRYIHGYVALPVMFACYQRGLFKRLSQRPHSLDQLVQHLGANPGHLQTALRMFESLDWIKKNSSDVYTLHSTHYQLLNSLPDNILSLYKIPFDQLLEKEGYKKTLHKWITFVLNHSVDEDPVMQDFVQGIVIVPLLIALHQKYADTIGLDKPLFFSGLPKGLYKQIVALFVTKRWAKSSESGEILTEVGLFMLERAYNMATAASYAPMLNAMPELLFGDPKKVFGKNEAGHELHVDRSLNVIGSGFQHVRYFEDAEEVIISLFNQKPYENQPKYIIDTGCGDGTLLKKIYEIICAKSSRGKVINQFPLYMIGVDFNKKSLAATEATLHEIPHYTLHGDIGDPAQIMQDLKKLGIKDPENSLHIRSFLDHDRPYLAPQGQNEVEDRIRLNYQGVYVDSEGKSIHPAVMVQSLVEHLLRWASIISKHGLLILEVHCLTPKTVFNYLNQNESLHFDAYHAFSKQYLVEADVFLMSAAEVGLFPKVEFSHRYPQTLPYSRITLNYFEKAEYTIECAKLSDLPSLMELEKKSWTEALWVSQDVIRERMEQFPEGQLVVKQNNQIIGVAYTQKIQNADDLTASVFSHIHAYHHTQGNVIQLLGISVAPEMQDTGLGSKLREFILWWAALKGMNKVVGITRSAHYQQSKAASMEEYIRKHIDTQGGIDPILRFHTSYGATIKAIIPNYRPEDISNDGAGILIEYTLQNRPALRHEKNESSKIKKGNKQSKEKLIKETVNHYIIELLPEKYRHEFAENCALRDMGFDSLSLLELRTLLNQHFKLELDPTIFFEYGTPAAVSDYLNQQVLTYDSDVETNSSVSLDISATDEDAIAIIGMACRFPNGINNGSDFWDLLINSKNSVTPVPSNRKKILGDSIAYGGFVTDIDCFDANFFRISPREAELMDPQQRILLETAWIALENAGLSAVKLSGTKTGVYVGIFSHDYESLVNRSEHSKDRDAYFATGNSNSVAAGRLSYVLGLQGPAMAVNTACSSSLVAVHLACQSLRQGESDLALAAGVNLILSPELNVAFKNAGMIAPDGKCKTFDNLADGYVRSEGCGVVVLKKLSQALTDQDTILAIIRSSVINQDGASNGLTAPSKLSQEKLLRSALAMANISSDSISYLETHGTGTALGDPIEVKAITEVYRVGRDKEHPLWLGSVKTNIGHAEAVAGIAGLIKSVLMLQHHQIPANLHFTQLNAHIDLASGLFKIPTAPRAWPSHPEFPRRMGVSAFGFSGTNAHVILEEAPARDRASVMLSKPPYLFTLSAKTEGSLKNRLADFEGWLAKQEHEVSLEEISYTLNLGRSHFQKRYAIVAGSVTELKETLHQIIINNKTLNNVYTNIESEHIAEAEDIDADFYRSLQLELTNHDYHKKLHLLANYYVHGAEPQWEHLYTSGAKRRLPLPSYPFSRERYWLPDSITNPTLNPSVSSLHPLLDVNVSTLGNYSFTKDFRADAFYLSDHCIDGVPILPGVAYLEMAVAAATIFSPQHAVVRLSNVVWIKPIALEKDRVCVAKITLFPNDQGVDFEVTTVGTEAGSQPLLHARGTLYFANAIGHISSHQMDIPSLQSSNKRTITKNEIYQIFHDHGLQYGAHLTVIDMLWSDEQSAIAALQLPDSLKATFADWHLHPSLLDGVLQTALGLILVNEASLLPLPFSVESVDILHPISPHSMAYAYAKMTENGRFDLMLLDAEGEVSVRLHQVSVRRRTDQKALTQQMDYCPRWIKRAHDQRLPLINQNALAKSILIMGSPESKPLQLALIEAQSQAEIRHLMLPSRIHSANLFVEKLGKIQTLDEIIFFAGLMQTEDKEDVSSFEQAQNGGVLALFHLLKALLQLNLLQPKLVLKVVTFNAQHVLASDVVIPHYASLLGLTQVFAKEFPAIEVSCLDLCAHDLLHPAQSVAAILSEPPQKLAENVAIREGNRYLRVLEPATLSHSSSFKFRQQGVYFIVGGAGGIGFALSEYLAKQYQAKLVWVARRSEDEYQEKIASIHSLGGEVLYCQADASDISAMQHAVALTKARFGVIHGAIHSALVLKDKTLQNMDEATFLAALSPKTQGSVVLHQVLKQEMLDFMLLFSSTQSYLTYPGQSNYAAGCTFQDAFAQSLQNHCPYPVKVINWGYWGTVGVVATSAYRERMNALGMDSITPEEGIAAIHRILAAPLNQLLVIKARNDVLVAMGLDHTHDRVLISEQVPSCFQMTTERAETRIRDLDFPVENADKSLQSFYSLLLIHVFQSMGVFCVDNQTYDKDALPKQLAILPKYAILFNSLLVMLENADYIRLTGNIISVRHANRVSVDQLNNDKETLLTLHPNLRAHINLLWACLLAYPDVLVGKKSHMEVMFPNGSLSLVEGIYHNQTANYFNQCVAITIRAYVEKRQQLAPRTEMRVLEIGAGTGGTSLFVLKELAETGADIRYLYTDISAGFLKQAHEKWHQQYPWITFQKLDIEKSPLDQDFMVGCADVVFASNVLHATKDIAVTLMQVKQLLKAQGLLILNEMVQSSEFATLTFGLTDGWWLFEDSSYRIPASPLLAKASWQTLLTRAGFKFHDMSTPSTSQAVFTVESNGLVIIPKKQRDPRLSRNEYALSVKAPVSTLNAGKTLEAQTQEYLISVFSKVLKIRKTDFSLHQTFENYGVDSLITLEINKELSSSFGSLPATLLFEYMTLDKLATYFIQHHHSALDNLFGTSIPSVNRAHHVSTPVIQSVKSASHPCHDVAIIGCSGRYPEAKNLTEFWALLREGKSAIATIPNERWDWRDYFNPTPSTPGKSYSQFGGFIQDADKFDPSFFHIPPSEAENMDPQERVFLEMAWALFEDAGYTKDDLTKIENQVGVFVGVMNHDYSLYQDNGQHSARSAYWSVANRVSYYFDFHGPSMAVDTACSSSLTALHLAYQSLCRGECALAIAGGVNLILHPNHYINLCQLHMLSPSEHCKSFGHQADGFVVGEGAGAVLLKPLDKALQDGDLIYGVIKGTAVNTGGKTSGYTVPNPVAQAELVTRAMRNAHIEPHSISYVEAHGTGTALGDPIEMTGLSKAFGTHPSLRCAVGSVKTNIGHLESAAGIAGLTKILLQMKYAMLVPSLHSDVLNPHINFEQIPFYIPQEVKEWKRPHVLENGVTISYPRRAGVSSFGAGGANAHIIIEEAPFSPAQSQNLSVKPCYLFTLSAKTETALKHQLINLEAWLTNQSSSLAENPHGLEEISYTLNTKRNHFDWRCALISGSLNDLTQTLHQINTDHHPKHVLRNGEGKKSDHEPILEELLLSLLNDIAHSNHLDTSVYSKKLLALGDLYIKGYDIDWDRVHTGEAKKKIALPTYPFARERYWISDSPTHIVTEIKNTAHHETLFEKVSTKIHHIVSDILKIKKSNVDTTKKLSEYGMDSIHVMTLTNVLNTYYQLALTPAHLFEHSTLASFANYVVTSHHEVLQKHYEMPLHSASLRRHLPTRHVQRSSTEPTSQDDIAVIGMSGIFPGAVNIAEFWENLMQGKDSIREIPGERWDWKQYDGDPFTEKDKTHIRWGGFIDNIAGFDAPFFNISAREAELIDPQQRLFLQVVWKTIEDAGYSVEEIAQLNTGLFVGATNDDYAELISQMNITDTYAVTGTTRSMMANRVSYLFNLKGPSEVIDTACSSSLVAIHHAIQAIRNGDCEVAIAGGVNALLTPSLYLAASKAGMLSEAGKCKTFDKNANGYVRGEGIAAILLKPLNRAQAEGDTIYGVIKGTAVNHGGHVSSLTVPNPIAQAEVILSAHRRAQMDVENLTYIETHGTGTALGDPIEINGLKQAFTTLAHEQNKTITKQYYCGLGAVKTNIGHLESAAGMASIIKVLLALRHAVIPGNLNFEELSPYIELTESPFYILKQTQDWVRLKDEQGHDIPRCAGVSSFGFGGVNAHVVIAEAPPQLTFSPSLKPCYLITLSAKQEESLTRRVIDLKNWLENHPDHIDLEALSYTCNAGRSHFQSRCAFVVSSVDELVHGLAAIAEDQPSKHGIMNTLEVPQAAGPVFDQIYKMAITGVKDYSVLSLEAYREKLLLIADLYTKQYPIDWSEIHIGEKKQRLVSLPSYPFSQQRYWLPTAEDGAFRVRVNPNKTPDLAKLSPDLQGLTLHYLQSIFAEKLKIPAHQIEVESTYETYGVDSLLVLDITKRLEQDFGTLPKTLLYERNQLIKLEKFFSTKYKPILEQLFLQTEGAFSTPLLNPSSGEENVSQSIMHAGQHTDSMDIAIIGLSGTYPLAKDINKFWDNLVAGRDCVTEVPLERWNYKDYPVKVGGKAQYYNQGGFIDDVDKFDPLFFNIAPRDAAIMDPQERLFLQSVWTTLEDAGYTRDSLQRRVDNKVGVFAGVTYNFYPLFIAEEWQKDNRLPLDIQLFSIANRASYFFNFNGPSYVIDTACSSSLAAIHLACESIIRGECKMAVAGGVNLSLHPSKYHMLGSYNFMSEQGRCTSFGAGGTGYVPGEGVGSVLLKPLSQAIRDNDRIYGVIKGSNMNHGGKTSGYTVPNPTAQADLVKGALLKANMDPRSISYIEAHGTGTALGDPIEISGLQEAFEAFTHDKQFCAIGSVKSNIGHLESAAGISQLTKVLLQMRHKKLVPSLHAAELNPFIDFGQTAFYVQQHVSDWKTKGNNPRRAGISSFGAGGTNIHLIIEEYIAESISASKQQNQEDDRPFLFVLSALNPDRLREYVSNMREFLRIEVKQHPTEAERKQWLNALCYTAQTGREGMPARLAIVAESYQTLLNGLERYLAEGLQSRTPNSIWVNHAAEATASKEKSAELIKLARYADIAECWVSGAKMPWELLYANQKMEKVYLPGYPFAKRRCWVSEKQEETSRLQSLPDVADASADNTLLPPLISTNELSTWLYGTHWIEQPLDNVVSMTSEKSHWLIFVDNVVDIPSNNTPITSYTYCIRGTAFEKLNDNLFSIDDTSAEDFHQVFRAVHREKNTVLKGVIYHGGLLAACDPMAEEALSENGSLAKTSVPLLYLFQAMSKQKWQHPLRFCLVTRHSQSITHQEPIQLWQHYLWSLTRIFVAERGDYQALLLDVDANMPLTAEINLIEHELRHFCVEDNHIAYRNDVRYSLQLSREANKLTAIRENAWQVPEAALITGGLGALGAEVATWLAQQGTKYLLLIGSTVLPHRSAWPAIEDKGLREKIIQIQALEQLGACVHYAAVDVTHKIEMQRLIETTENTWQSSIQGVFHLAGITTDSIPIDNMSNTLLQRVLAVKVQGALVLHDLFNQSNLQCFVLFSSISALPYFGISGLSAYAMANEFLNGLALYRRQKGLPAISINWAAWAEKGMSFKYNHSAFMDVMGMAPISPAEGIQSLKYLLSLQPINIAVLKVNWEKFLKVNADAKRLRFFNAFIDKTKMRKEKSIAATITTSAQVTALLSDILANLLQLELNELELSMPFQQYGMDSIIGVDFIAKIGEHFPDTVSPMDLYRYPSLKQLSDYILLSFQKQDVMTDEDKDQFIHDINALSDEQIRQLIDDELLEVDAMEKRI